MADIAKITLKGESEAKNFIDEALRGDIAYEELSTTVSKAGGYVAGDHLIYLGQYYEVVADIAQGGTIVTSGAGQNVEEREVGDEIKKNKTQYEVMPVASADYLNRVITYIGATTATYTSGQSYQCVYDSVNDTYSWEATSSKVEIDNKTIVENADGELETAVKTFTGKRAAWNALSAEEKAYYDGGIVNFTDDSEDAGSVLGVICDVETSPATAAHSAGDQFYYDGALVEATSAIAIGDTIVVSPDTEYNVKVADKVVAQMQTLETALTNEITNRTNADALKANETVIATRQTNLTASRAYKIGEHFIYNGVLYDVITAISSGGTIVINGNCKISSELADQITFKEIVETGAISRTPTISNFTDYNEVVVIGYSESGWVEEAHLYPKFQLPIAGLICGSSSTTITTASGGGGDYSTYMYASVNSTTFKLSVSTTGNRPILTYQVLAR